MRIHVYKMWTNDDFTVGIFRKICWHTFPPCQLHSALEFMISVCRPSSSTLPHILIFTESQVAKPNLPKMSRGPDLVKSCHQIWWDNLDLYLGGGGVKLLYVSIPRSVCGMMVKWMFWQPQLKDLDFRSKAESENKSQHRKGSLSDGWRQNSEACKW